jgi:transposase
MDHPPLPVSDAQRRLLNSWIRAGTTPQRVVTRARIVLLAAQGQSARTIATTLEVNPRTVTLWRQRYDRWGPHILWHDAPGRGRKRSIDAEALIRLRALLASPAPDGGQWSVRRLAGVTGLSRSSVHRLLSSAGAVASGQQRRARALLIRAKRVAVANSEAAPDPSSWALDFE